MLIPIPYQSAVTQKDRSIIPKKTELVIKKNPTIQVFKNQTVIKSAIHEQRNGPDISN